MCRISATAIRQMILPGMIAVISPVVIGFGLGAESLGGLLAGVTVSGVCMAIFMSNAGGARDNAKKSFEGGGYTMENGEVHEKDTPAHNAAVVGDTVGSVQGYWSRSQYPCRVIGIALVIAPLLKGLSHFIR